MPYKKNDDGTFTVTSRSGSAHKWTVSSDLKSCDCPKFKYILKMRVPCHHIDEVRQGELKSKPDNPDFPKFVPEKYEKIMSLDNFIDVFGDEQYDNLIMMQEIILYRGYVRVLR